MNKNFEIAFFGSSDFVIPILDDIYQNQGKTLREVFWSQYEFLGQSILSEIWRDRSNLERMLDTNLTLDLSIELKLIVTQPDKQNRKKTIKNPVSVYAEEKGIQTFKPEKINKESEVFSNLATGLNLAITASFGQIISQAILDIPNFGFINWHPSKLPNYRGPTPMQSAILNGDKLTALTWIVMTRGMDAGDILLQIERQIENKNIFELAKEMGELGAKTWALSTVSSITPGIQKISQNKEVATFTKMLSKEDKLVDSENNSATEIYNHFRAFKIFPGTSFRDDFFGMELKIKNCQPAKVQGKKIFESKSWLQTEESGKIHSYLKCKKSFLEIFEIIDEKGKIRKFEGFRFI